MNTTNAVKASLDYWIILFKKKINKKEYKSLLNRMINIFSILEKRKLNYWQFLDDLENGGPFICLNKYHKLLKKVKI